MKEVNGKYYPLWQQFVDRKEEFIGGTMVATDEGITARTVVTDVVLEPNGEASALFGFKGEEFNCTFDVRYGGVSGDPKTPKGAISFSMMYAGSFTIYPKAIEAPE